jgi:excisionase family DNA binding protein
MINPTPIPRRYASIAEAARYVGVHPRTIRRHIAAGRLTGFHLGQRLIRVDLDELDQMLAPIPTARADDD